MQFHPMKIITPILTTALLLLAPASKAMQEIDSVALIVNDSIISKQKIEQRLVEFKRQVKLQGQRLPDDSVLKKQLIERMILDNIQLQLAETQGISIDDLTLNNMLEGIAQKNRTTLDQMRRTLESSGVNYKQFREQTRKDMIIRQLQQRMIFSRVKVSEQEINIFLEQNNKNNSQDDQYHIAHILIATPESASPEEVNNALEKAQQAIQDIENGTSFHDTALNYSDGRHALKGGDLGWRTAAALPPLFLENVRKMKASDISLPLRSASGFHILKLLDTKTERHLVNQTHARHILIKTDEITTERQAKDKIDSISKRLQQGEDFAKLAEQFSQDPGSKNNGGDLGWATEGTFVPRFNQVMNSLKIGQISRPFKSQFGWHIVEVLERRQQDETEQRIRQKAERAIQNRKADEELQLWLRQIRDEAYVEYRIEQ